MNVPSHSSDATHEEPIFSVVLTPHRSLNERGFRIVMAVFGSLIMVPIAIFWAIGAWPVLGFLGLDIVLVVAAFRLNFRAARAAEEIRVTRDTLTICATTPSGRRTETVFNPYWARLEVIRRPEIGIVSMQVASHGTRLEIGRFLPLPQRERFARLLGAALAEARTSA